MNDGSSSSNDRFIAAVDPMAFELGDPLGLSAPQSAPASTYRQTLSQRMGVTSDVFVHAVQPLPASSVGGRLDLGGGAAGGDFGFGGGFGGAFGPQLGTSAAGSISTTLLPMTFGAARDSRGSSPPQGPPSTASGERTPFAFGSLDAVNSLWSPPDATPGEGNTTPRKQIGSTLGYGLDRSPEAHFTGGGGGGFASASLQPFTALRGTPSRSPLMRTPVQGIEPLALSPFASPSPQRQAPPQPFGFHSASTGRAATPGTVAPSASASTVPMSSGAIANAGVAASSWMQPSVLRTPLGSHNIAGSGLLTSSAARRRDGMTPSRILDAKGISDALDVSVVAWGRQFLVIALGSVVYLWSPEAVRTLFEARCEVTAVCCSRPEDDDDFVGVGLANGLMHTFRIGATAEHITAMPTIVEHSSVRVTSMALARHTLYSGTDDGVLCIRDLHSTQTWRATLDSAIYMLSVTTDQNHVAVGTASGVVVYHNSNLGNPTVISESCVPVRAMAWAPHCDVGTLAFSSGALNTEVVVYSLGSGVKATADVGAELCCLAWTPHSEVVVGCGTAAATPRHGGALASARRPGTPAPAGGSASSLANSIGIFEYAGDAGRLRRVATIAGHAARVLHCALSPDGTTLVTGAGGADSTLRFWSTSLQPTMRMLTPPINAPLFDDEIR